MRRAVVGACVCPGRARRPCVAWLAALAVVVAAGCADDPATDAAAAATPALPAADAVDLMAGATTYLAERLDDLDAPSLMVLDYLARNWGVTSLRDAPAAAAGRMARGDDEALRRLVEPDAAPSRAPAQEPATEVLAAALHCDRGAHGAPELAGLEALAGRGGHATTHAALAVGWLSELGCAAPSSVRAAIVDRLAAELASAEAVTDLALEQSATLHYLGAADRVPDDWAVRVAGAVNADGGWGPAASDGHTTMLALWTLLAEDGPGAGAPMLRAAT